MRPTSRASCKITAIIILVAPAILIAQVGGPANADDRAWRVVDKAIRVDTTAGVLSLPSELHLSDTRRDGKSTLNLRVDVDLAPLQESLSSFLPKENCRSFSATNVVADVDRSTIAVEEGKLRLDMKGEASVWACLENPVPNSKVIWEEKHVGLGIKTRVPVVQTWPGPPIKSRRAVYPYAMTNMFSLQVAPGGVVQVRDVSNPPAGPIEPSLREAAIKALPVLQNISAVESSLKVLPPEFGQVNFAASSAAFSSKDGKPIATIVYSAELTSAQADVLKQRLLEVDSRRN